MSNKKEKNNNGVISQIPVTKLDLIIEKKECTIIDVRNSKGIEKQGSIPGAFNIPFDLIEYATDKQQDDYNPVFDEEGPFLFCCTGGVMSYVAALKAQENGVKNVCNLDGGHSAWIKIKKFKEAV